MGLEKTIRKFLGMIGQRRADVRYNALVSSSHDAICETSDRGKILYLNPNYKKVLGYELNELLDKNLFDIVHQEDASTVMAEFKRAIQSGTSSEVEHRFMHKNGESSLFESTLYTYKTRTGNTNVVISSSDITELRRAKQELKDSAKFAIIGRITGNILHDFTNYLTPMEGNLQFVMSGTFAEEQKKALTETIQICQLAKTIIENLLGIIKQKPQEPTYRNINSDIDGALVLYSRQLEKKSYKLIKDYDEGLPAILARHDYLTTAVFANLIINAMQAMPNGGTLKVKTSIEEPCIRVDITDTGYGIPPDRLEKIFEALYTSKEGGTGLGLPHAKMVVEEHGGKIGVESKVDEGTTFSVYLPITN